MAFSFGNILNSTAGASAVGYGLQGLFSAVAAERERAWSEKMYNKYNSPAALVRQYREAGINPALMFGQSPTPAAMTSSQAAMPQNPVGDVVGLLGQLMELSLLEDKRENVKADTALKSSSAAGQDIENAFKPDLFRQQLEKGQIDIRQAELGCQKTSAEIGQIVAETKDSEELAKLHAAQRVLAFAQTALANMQTSESYSRIGVNNAEARSINQDVARKEFENAFQREFGVRPDTAIWNSVTGLLGHSARRARSEADKVGKALRDEALGLGARVLGNVREMSDNARNRWEYYSAK